MATRIFQAEQVAAACAKYQAWRAQQIADAREKMIAAYMRPRFFGRIRPTREQALKYLKNEFFGDYGLADTWWGRQASEVERLLRLAQSRIAIDNLIEVDEGNYSHIASFVEIA